MKNLLILSLFIGLINTADAQTAQNSNEITETNTVISTQPGGNELTVADLTKSMKTKHNLSFTNQISEFISNNIEYPEELRQYAVEGTVVIKVSLNEIGNVTNYEIKKNLNNKLDSLVVAEFQNFTKVKIEEDKYYGTRSINVPVSFSIDR